MTNTNDKTRMSHNVCYAAKYHLVKEAKTCAVYPASAFDDCEYTGSPVVVGDYDTCRDYLEDRDLRFVEVVRGFIVPLQFVHDLCRLADRVREELDAVLLRDCLSLESHITAYGSAAHCYIGDMGSCARLVGDTSSPEAQNCLIRLIGIAEAAWELGFTLCYDAEGRHTVTRSSEYVHSMEG